LPQFWVSPMIDHCEFTILEISITEDESRIKEAFSKTEKKYAAWQNDTDPLKRTFYKRIMVAGATLFGTGNKRPDIIQEHKDALAEHVESFVVTSVQMQGGDKISDEGYGRLIEFATNEDGAFHLDDALAKQVIDEVLAKYKISVGGSFTPAPPAPPRLIDDFSVVTQKSGLMLTWKLPERNCDRVVLRRSYESFPKDEKSGEPLFDGNGQEVLDDTVEVAKTVFYSAFSFYQGEMATGKVAREGFFAQGVTNFDATDKVGQIELRWNPPQATYKRIVIFRGAPNQPPKIVFQDGVPTPEGATLLIEPEQDDRYLDEMVTQGATYYYSICVDYGSVDSRQIYSEPQTRSGSSIPTAKPVKSLQLKSQKQGLELTWEMPKSRCDGVKIVRRKDRVPRTETDGDLRYNGTGQAFIDDKEHLEAGVTYSYAVFSVYRGQASAKVTGKKIYAGDVKNFTASEGHVGFIRLQWTSPTTYEKILLYRKPLQEPLYSGRLPRYDDYAVLRETELHYSLVVRYADGQESSGVHAEGKALEPIRHVKTLSSSVDSKGHVHLRWDAPDSNKRYKYAIHRQEKSPTKSWTQANRIAETDTTTYLDDKTEPGKEYAYAIYSRLEGTNADQPAVNDIFVTADVDKVNATVGYREVSLQWERPANVKRVEVLRNQKRIPWTDQTSVIDQELESGRTYHYNIISVFVDSFGKAHRSKGIEREVHLPKLPEIELKKVIVGYREVRLEWNPPTDVNRVEVLCDGKKIEIENLTSVTAQGLRPGSTYRYKITSVFVELSGNESRSKGVEREVHLPEPPSPLKQLTATPTGETIAFRWELPKSSIDAVVILRADAPPKESVGQIFPLTDIPSTPHLLERLPGDKTSYHDREVRFGDVYCYAFYTVKADMAVYSGASGQVPLLENVTHLTARNWGDTVCLKWQWPTYVNVVQVFRERTDNGQKKSWYYTRELYNNQGTILLDQEVSPGRKYRYRIHTCLNHQGQVFKSPDGAAIEVLTGDLPLIDYQLDVRRKRRWKRNRSTSVEVVCDISRVKFPFGGLVLRKKKLERPRNARDGEEVCRWQGSVATPSTPVILTDASPELDGETYYRVFLIHPEDEKSIKIRLPPVNRVRV
jgi:phage-related protein